MSLFSKVLVANRGEIAVRIIRSARENGYRTVAVYSQADHDAPHVTLADEAVCIGPAEVSESYLNTDAILDAARKTGAQAVHPGYGFLSENAAFAEACDRAGLVFIGPKPVTIDLMGNKRAAKRRMAEVGIPCIPGYSESQEEKDLIEAGKQLGFPLMVKAAAGGGGRGMRLVVEATELPQALQSARAEAEHGFGNGELILEKAVIRPRHIEIQIVADAFGHVLSLAERDCSVQRRHQKVVEEAPGPAMEDDLRQRMGEAAVMVARAVDYVGVGTVEFLVDEKDHFYFMEMNTRLQVEHGVTELITGVDLVALQLQVADREPLELHPEDIALIGHAVEVRLYAEDPAAGFLPSTGKIHDFRPPEGEGIRVDTGLRTGQTVSSHYDPMLAKIMAWGGDREQAMRRLIAALHETVVAGVTTNRDYLISILEHPVFIEGDATTDFIDLHLHDYTAPKPGPRSLALATALFQHHGALQSAGPANFFSALPTAIPFDLRCGDTTYQPKLIPQGENCYDIHLMGETKTINMVSLTKDTLRFDLDGIQQSAAYTLDGHMLYLDAGRCLFAFEDRTLQPDTRQEAAGEGMLKAVMDGRIMSVLAQPGDRVQRGQALVVMEAMKMEHRIIADKNGTVGSVHIESGDQVAARQLLIELTGDPA